MALLKINNFEYTFFCFAVSINITLVVCQLNLTLNLAVDYLILA